MNFIKYIGSPGAQNIKTLCLCRIKTLKIIHILLFLYSITVLCDIMNYMTIDFYLFFLQFIKGVFITSCLLGGFFIIQTDYLRLQIGSLFIIALSTIISFVFFHKAVFKVHLLSYGLMFIQILITIKEKEELLLNIQEETNMHSAEMNSSNQIVNTSSERNSEDNISNYDINDDNTTRVYTNNNQQSIINNQDLKSQDNDAKNKTMMRRTRQ